MAVLIDYFQVFRDNNANKEMFLVQPESFVSVMVR